jgi:hypothetical protein
MPQYKFNVGDRVTRPVDIWAPETTTKRLKHGVVTERYAQRPKTGPMAACDHELYAVQWDGEEQPQRGYFAHGLEFERYDLVKVGDES